MSEIEDLLGWTGEGKFEQAVPEIPIEEVWNIPPEPVEAETEPVDTKPPVPRKGLKQIIITRFSVRIDYMNTSKQGKLFSPRRLETRFRFFESFCLPAVLKQVHRAFEWIILIDPELPAKYREKLEGLVGAYDNIHLLEWGPWQRKLGLGSLRWVEEVIPLDGVKHLATIRLDDDDVLHPRFTQRIAEMYRNKYAKLRHFRFITFPQGLTWLRNKRSPYGNTEEMQSTFIGIGMTLLTTLPRYPLNVYGFGHHKFRQILQGGARNYLTKRVSGLLERKERFTNPKQMLEVVRTPGPFYIYCLHDQNDGNFRRYARKQDNAQIQGVLKRFNLDPRLVRKCNRG